MSPKIGRPKSTNPKNQRLEIRITMADAERLNQCAKVLGVTRTDVLLKGLDMVEKEIKK